MTEQADHLHHDNAPVHSTALVQAFLAKHRITQVSQPPYSPDLAPCDFWLFPKLKSPLKGRRFVYGTITQYTSSIKGADWLAPWESDCSWMHSKVSSDWLSSYIKATRLVLEIFKTAGYFPDSPRKLFTCAITECHCNTTADYCLHCFLYLPQEALSTTVKIVNTSDIYRQKCKWPWMQEKPWGRKQDLSWSNFLSWS
jgi:hypothetical protein